MEDLGKIKGNAIHEFVEWFGSTHGWSGMRRAILALPVAEQRMFALERPGLGLSRSEWYSARTVHHFLDEITRGMTAEDVAQVADDGGEATVKGMMRGAQGIVFAMFVSPSRYGLFVPKLWRLNYDTGRLEHEMLDATSDETRIHEWRGHHPLLCRLNTAVKVKLYASVGCRNVVVERRYCVSSGDAMCGSRARWTAG